MPRNVCTTPTPQAHRSPSPARFTDTTRLPRHALDGGEGKIIMTIDTCLNTHHNIFEPLDLETKINTSGTDAGKSTANGLVTQRNPTQILTHNCSIMSNGAADGLAPVDDDSSHTTSVLAGTGNSNAIPPPGPEPPTITTLLPPILNNMKPVRGASTKQHRKENKQRRRQKQLQQTDQPSLWTHHRGDFVIPPPVPKVTNHRNNMCPAGLALHHPAATLLTSYATLGCPTQTGNPWSITEMKAAILRGPHASALEPEAAQQLWMEVEEKVRKGQARIVSWDDIKHDPPPQLKISPIAMIPHKSRLFRAILDLSFPVKLKDGTIVPSVNDGTTKTAPRGAIDQIGHALQRIIHAFAAADTDAKIFMAKWDIKDGFWRLDCEQGEEWNFAYVLPPRAGIPTQLVIPTSLQMGWIESPPYFCTASETARDVAEQYVQLPLGTMEPHKFLPLTELIHDINDIPQTATEDWKFMLEVYMDDYIGLAIPTSRVQLQHFANAVMYGIHDVFPPDLTDEEDPISLKKLRKSEGSWAIVKDILGLTFDGDSKTVWLENDKRDAILTIINGWIRHSNQRNFGIPFTQFRSVIAKIRHAFITIPAGRGLLSPFNTIIRKAPSVVYLHKNEELRWALKECRTFLRESVGNPTKCSRLVTKWPDFIGVKDASSHGVGGIIIGENKAARPTVFRMQWPPDITASIVSDTNPAGTITNSDLEMAGLLLLWLVMEEVCPTLEGAHIALFSDNSPTVHWVQRMAAKQSCIAMQLLRALALRLQLTQASPLTPLHISGIHNAMTDIPSRSFGSEKKWFCKTDEDLRSLFNLQFPLPSQASWNVFQLSQGICTKVISVLRTKVSTTDEWRRLPQKGTMLGTTGAPMSHLWDWTLYYRTHHTPHKCEHSPDLRDASEQDTTAADAKLRLQQSIALSQPLARRSPWPRDTIQQK